MRQILTPMIPDLPSPSMITSMDLPSIVAYNPNLAYQLFLVLLTAANAQPQGPYPYLDVLTRLPPTLPSFDLLVRLLQDTSIVIDPATGGKTTIADVVRIEVLGRFIHGSIQWLDNAEREEQEGLISDDRVAKAVQNVRTHHVFRLYTLTLRRVSSSVVSMLPCCGFRSWTWAWTWIPPRWRISRCVTHDLRKQTRSIDSWLLGGFEQHPMQSTLCIPTFAFIRALIHDLYQSCTRFCFFCRGVF